MSGRTEGGNVERPPQIPLLCLPASQPSNPAPDLSCPAQQSPRGPPAQPRTRRLQQSPQAASPYAHPQPPQPAKPRPPSRSAVSRTSAATASIPDRPPPSTTTETFGPSRPSSPAASMPLRIACGKPRRIGDLLRVEPGKRRRFDRNARPDGNPQRIDVASQIHRRPSRQPPDLQIAARRSLRGCRCRVAARLQRVRRRSPA